MRIGESAGNEREGVAVRTMRVNRPAGVHAQRNNEERAFTEVNHVNRVRE